MNQVQCKISPIQVLQVCMQGAFVESWFRFSITDKEDEQEKEEEEQEGREEESEEEEEEEEEGEDQLKLFCGSKTTA